MRFPVESPSTTSKPVISFPVGQGEERFFNVFEAEVDGVQEGITRGVSAGLVTII